MTSTTIDTAQAYRDDIRRSQRRVQTVERKSVLTYRVIMAVLLAIAILAFVPVNTVHNFQYFEGILGTIEGGTADYMLYFVLAGALVIVSAGLWMLLPQTEGLVWALCFAFAMGAGLFSHYASYLSLDRQAVAAIHQETADSARSKIAMMGVEAMRDQVRAAANNSDAANAAVKNLTSQYGNWDAASVGEVNRNQLPGLTAAQGAAGANLQEASRAMERAMEMAQEVADGAGEGVTVGVFEDLGKMMGWTPEGTRVFTNAFGSGIISWVPLIVTYVMGFAAFRDPEDEESGNDRGGNTKPQKEREPDYLMSRQSKAAMPSNAPNAVDSIKGPEVGYSDAPDTAPGGKRQAEFSKKLARLEQSIGAGREFEPGDKITGPRIKEIVGGNNETVSALRDALVNNGRAYWQGKTIYAAS